MTRLVVEMRAGRIDKHIHSAACVFCVDVMMARYGPLTVFLAAQPSREVRMSFDEIERVLGRGLPRSAATQRAFWSNNASNNVMTRAWLAAGFRSEQVDLPGRTLVFRRERRETGMSGFEEAQAPFLARDQPVSDKLALFGWMKGTVTVAPGVDLTEPADPDWTGGIDELAASPA